MLRAMRRRALAALLLLVSCSQPSRVPRGGSGEIFDLDAARESLAIPPDEGTEGALERIEQAAAGGDTRAAWVVAHYLIDLFDYARLSGDGATRALLFKLTKVPEGTGAEVTERVLEALLLGVDRVLRADRLHAGAQAARTLLEWDQRPAEARTQLFERTAQLKVIARGKGPLAANATLRLAAFCRSAFHDAARAAAPFRPGILSYCLYPLYDSDPEPYFDSDPARRPPEPAWTDLAADVKELHEEVAGAASRLSRLGKPLIAADEKFLAEAKPLMPTRRDPRELHAPMVPFALPYEWTPLVLLADGSQIAADLAKKIEPALAQDRRGRVALALAGEAPATALVKAAEAARAAGALEVELVVGYEQALQVPAGDYWSGRMQGDRVLRLGVLPVALDTLGAGTGAPTSAAHGAPRAVNWDPARAALKLHLVVSATEWRIIAPGGELPAIPAAELAAATAALRAQLAEVRSAFGDEDGLVLVPGAGATIGMVAAAAAAARTDDAGRVMFGALALAAAPPQARGDLAARVARRAAAKVTIAPDTLAERVPAVRRCYQDALDKAPKLAGTFEIALATGGGEAKPKITSGPREAALRACVLERLAAPMIDGNVQSVRVTLAPR